MQTPNTSPTTDPLAAFLSTRQADRRPLPLAATALEVEIAGGVVVVSVARTYRNLEEGSIEAVLTFPVPVHATLFGLEARIGGRVLRARAQARDAARETYETALSDGLTSALHEEVLRGVHMLSVGPLAPGAEVVVTSHWASTLSMAGGAGHLRIPMTVGEVYGCSPLADSDELTTGAPADMARLTVRCDRPVELHGGRLHEGAALVPTDAPVDLVVRDPCPQPALGLDADGQALRMTVVSQLSPTEALDVAILVDRSGSMAGLASGLDLSTTTHEAVRAALRAAAYALQPEDRIDLWQFNCVCERVGDTRNPLASREDRGIRARFGALVTRLEQPAGGTEIGDAILEAMRHSDARDLLMISDGRSHALDIQRLARDGRRISALLVGEDSLDANVGHLAALSGGDLIVGAGAEFGSALAAGLSALRGPSTAAVFDADRRRLQLVRRGAEIVAEPAVEAVPSGLFARGVGALAAGLRLPLLSDAKAAELAAREGLVTHLTSLVLIDGEGGSVEGLPALRKVPLPTGRVVSIGRLVSFADVVPTAGEACSPVTRARIREIEAKALRKLKHPPRSHKLRWFLDADGAHGSDAGSVSSLRALRDAAAVPPEHALAAMARTIDWSALGGRLVRADLSALAPETADRLLRLSTRNGVSAIAQRLGLDPLTLLVGGMAAQLRRENRAAERVMRVVFRGIAREVVDRALDDLAAALGAESSVEDKASDLPG